MGGFMRRRLKFEIIRGCNFDDVVEGIVVRIRFLSYDEIMFKRKGKKEFEGFREEVREVKSIRRDGIVTSFVYYSRDIDFDVMKILRVYIREDSFRRKEEKIFRVEDVYGKSKKKESCDVEDRFKYKYDKDVRNDSRGRGRGI